MLRLLKRRRAIKQFVRELPLALHRRFGEKPFYSLDEVNRTSEALGYNKAFIAYAHALLCSRKEFEEYYSPLKVRSSYLSLRRKIGARYFRKAVASGFNAASVYRYAKDCGAKYDSDNFYESTIGQNYGTSGDHH